MPNCNGFGVNPVAHKLCVLLLLAATDSIAQQAAGTSPPDVAAHERAAFFGDLHLHTGLSFDAAASGTATSLDDAYRYALGEQVEYLGRTVQRQRPLDFLAVTDHAEYLGVAMEAADPGGRFAGTPWPQRLAAVSGDTVGYMGLFSASAFRGSAPPIMEFLDEALTAGNWQRVIAAAERYYRPEQFTTFVGFEWSPMPDGAHLHRNVIFRGPAFPARPFSAIDSPRPEDLWTYAEQLRSQQVESVLIPHNSNMSKGLMFAMSDSFGDPISRDYAERRLANERLVEITQNKGTSETRPEFGAPDEFAGFELLNLAAERASDPAGGYLRQTMARGLELEDAIGLNPFRFGFIGSSDFHSGVSATEEDNFTGALGRSDDVADADTVLNTVNPVAGAPSAVFSVGGLTGLWAERNTRESLFAAMQRREAFATSGTRIRVRMFAGRDFDAAMIDKPDWVQRAYESGYPMGADIPPAPENVQQGMQLIVHAVKDLEGANLDRIQVIKIWRQDGQAQERIFDVAWSGNRQPDAATGTLPAVGNTVDLAAATFTNTIGATELLTVWTDPEFDPQTPAIYYARVLEIPTPRWSTYLAVRNRLPLSTAVPATLQERAWTSPVFYSP